MQKKFSLKEARKAKATIVRRNFKPAVEKIEENVDQNKKRPCPPPPKEELDVIKVLKVFQECQLVDTNEILDDPIAPPGAVDVECLGAELIEPPSCFIDPVNQTITAVFSFVTAYQFLDENGDPIGDVQIIEVLDETRTVTLSRAGEPGLDCQVDIFLECIQCFVSRTGPDGRILEVTCCVGKQILFKLIAEVQLLVKTLGFAPEPPECEQVAGECPDFTPVWPPYPPQSPDFPPRPRGKCGGCK